MSDSKQNLDPDSLAYYAPSGSRGRKAAATSAEPGRAAQQRRLEHAAPHLRIVKPDEPRPKIPSDAFAAAVALAMRNQQEADLLDATSLLYRRASMPVAAKVAVAIAGAALAALAYVVLYPPAEAPPGDHATPLRILSPPPSIARRP